MSIDKQLILLWFAELLPPSEQKIAMMHLENDAIFTLSIENWVECGLSQKSAEKLCNRGLIKAIHESRDKMDRLGIRSVTKLSGEYPYTLSGSDKLPPILFVRKKPRLDLKPGVAIVGTRKPSAYGKEIAKAIAKEAAAQNIATISGAALGTDTAAHVGSLEASGKTVAVLGSGLFCIYPKSNTELLDLIAENGVVVSQFPPNRRPDRTTFPIRNELIAILSKSVVVTEGAKGSGARYTADYANKHNRKLFALPGEITNPQSYLPNKLIADGANMLLSPEDPLDLMSSKRGRTTQVMLRLKSKKSQKSIVDPDVYKDLNELESQVMKLIVDGKKNIDDIFAIDLEKIGAINEALLSLELKNLVRQEPGRKYVAIRSI